MLAQTLSSAALQCSIARAAWLTQRFSERRRVRFQEQVLLPGAQRLLHAPALPPPCTHQPTPAPPVPTALQGGLRLHPSVNLR